MTVSAHVVTHASPAYCSAGKLLAFKRGDTELIVRCRDVERPWKDEERDGENGMKPCLLYIEGEPFPWYVTSGWNYVRVFEQRFTGDD